MQDKPYIVIMAGGIGSRFWPYSRTAKPKQFLDILGTGRTLLQMTYDRFQEIASPEQFYVVTNQEYFDLVKEQLPELSDQQILTEPLRRNTATCVAYASFKISQLNPEATIVVTPADHLIIQEGRFIQTIQSAILAAQIPGRLITIGIKPNRPETGYGYIQYLESDNHHPSLKVKTFTEKPNQKLAKTFIESGDFVWNSGMFVWNVKSILEAYHKYMPDVADVFEEGKAHYGKVTEGEFINRAYTQVKNISIDYAVMEKANNVYVLPATFDWNDLGTWGSLHEKLDKDHQNNAVVNATVILENASNNIIRSNAQKLVVIDGLDDYIIVDNDSVLMIYPKSKEQDIKRITAMADKL